jgi:hypothetical protein
MYVPLNVSIINKTPIYAGKSGGRRCVAPRIVILSCDGTEWTALRARGFAPPPPPPKEKIVGSHCLRGWVGPKLGWTLWGREKSLEPAGS